MKKGDLAIAYFTSCRELSLEGVGTLRRAFLETLCNDPPVFVNGIPVCVTAVVVDDDEGEFHTAWRNMLWKCERGDKRTGNSVDFVNRITTAAYRKSKKAQGESLDEFRQRKCRERQKSEAQMLRVIRSAQVCAAICDSYMTILSKPFLEMAGIPFINIHPGITTPNDPNRTTGPTPTRDALTRARYGYILVDDKAPCFWPQGEVVTVKWNQCRRSAVLVPQVCATGVTAHLMDASVDDGRELARCIYDFDPSCESEETLRSRNYALKITAFSAAISALIREGVIDIDEDVFPAQSPKYG